MLREDKNYKISCVLSKEHLVIWVFDKEKDHYYRCVMVYNDELPKMIKEQIDDIKELYDYLRKNEENISFKERCIVIKFEFGLSKKLTEDRIELEQL